MNKQLSEEDSLSLINDMISRAKKSYSSMNFYFLLWGWLLLFAGIGEYILLYYTTFETSWIVWPAIGIPGGIIAAVYGKKQGQEKHNISFTDKMFFYVWTGFVICLICVIVSAISIKINPGPFIILLTGLPTFISGGILKFKPLIFGGISFWIIGLITFFWLLDYSSLTFSLSILLGYIIPGYMLKKAEQDGSL